MSSPFLSPDTCGGRIIINPSDKQQWVTSPGYPGNYPPHIDCVWKLVPPEGYTINYHLQDLEIEDHHNCFFDYLEIFNINKHGEIVQQSHLCGTRGLSNEVVAATKADTLTLRFHSDSTYTYRGFKLRYELESK